MIAWGFMFTGGILIASDKGAAGLRRDESGQAVRDSLSSLDIEWRRYEVVPDDRQTISARLAQWADECLDFIFTAGGTGLSPRDVTPEATLDVLDRTVPGFAEAMRWESLKKTPHAMLSRAVVGTRKGSLIVNLPGSPKAVAECLATIAPALPHAIETLRGDASECATRE